MIFKEAMRSLRNSRSKAIFFALTFYIYPQLDYKEMTLEEFAFWSENAAWVFSQQMMVGQASAMGMLGAGLKK